MTQSFRVVIPARFGSERLPGKPLLDICGKPMFFRVWEQARQSGAAEVVLATDDHRIANIAKQLGVDFEMTSGKHESGTDRVAEVASSRGWLDSDIVVNVQGDEPLVPPPLISQVANLLAKHRAAAVATLSTTLDSESDFVDSNCVKIVADQQGFALYFSRAGIPYPRDGVVDSVVRRHVGLYAYRVEMLSRLAMTPVCAIEAVEKLEQLRVLWLGEKIVVADAVQSPVRGVDTAEDLDAVRKIFVET